MTNRVLTKSVLVSPRSHNQKDVVRREAPEAPPPLGSDSRGEPAPDQEEDSTG